MPTIEELATQGASGPLQMEEQAKKVTLMGPQTLDERGKRQQGKSPQIDSAGETISVPVTGALAWV